jgi:hypothetical protein
MGWLRDGAKMKSGHDGELDVGFKRSSEVDRPPFILLKTAIQ